MLSQRQPVACVRLDREALIAALGARGLTVAELARAANVSENSIYNALRGKPVKLVTLRLIAGGLSRFPVVSGLSELIAT